MEPYVKYTCQSCGRVEYYNSRGARNWPNPFVKGCKRSKTGYHAWDKGVRVNEIPAYRTRK